MLKYNVRLKTVLIRALLGEVVKLRDIYQCYVPNHVYPWNIWLRIVTSQLSEIVGRSQVNEVLSRRIVKLSVMHEDG
jgi:hypothetical protein